MTVRATKHSQFDNVLPPTLFPAVWTPLLYIQKCAILIFFKFSDAHKNGAFEALNCRMVLKLTGHAQKDVSIGYE